MRVMTVAVGSVPVGVAPLVSRGDWPQTDTLTRLQATRTESGLDMFRELKFLAEGTRVPSLEADAELVTKAQLPGPATLLAQEEATLKGTFRSLRAALETLNEQHPLLNELWLDEPMLQLRPELTPLTGKCIAALRGEYFGMRFGVHTCSHAPFAELLGSGIDVLHADCSEHGAAIVAAWLDAGCPCELVLGVVPTQGDLEPERWLRTLRELVAQMGTQAPEVLRISTTCGLGTLAPGEARARMLALQELAERLTAD